MNYDALKLIIDLKPENWEQKLLEEISKDSQSIWHVLSILHSERERNGSLITDLNFQLSRAHLTLVEPALKDKKEFVNQEILKFYRDGRVKHCYTVEGLE